QVIEALQQALESLDIGNHHFVSEHRAALAGRLAELAPGDLQYTIFGVSGGEAVDTAIKIARKATRRRKIISAKGGYHGHTGLAVAAGDAKFSVPFLSDAPEFIQVPFNDLEALEAALDTEVAAVILETIPATLGMPLPAPGYFSSVKALCQRAGALLIIDEVQTGLGRTGKLWGIQHYHTVPDILVTGKGLSGGVYPITATLIRPQLERVFHDDPFSHISTFGGAEIGCCVAMKVLEISSKPTFLQHVTELAQILASGLGQLQSAFSPLFQEVRQNGLMIGLKMTDPRLGPLMTKTCFEAGLLCIFAGNDPSVVQFLPPLIIDNELAGEILQRLQQALSMAAESVAKGGE
ncbi:MAG: aspartate aminotransferase family protein, partial [Calditrichaeota bacterium]